ncbi:putative T7SS-secreted protein [Streptomyces sp. NPDC029674]|uniref:putative T7SS-secreted protein n=1 Tax=Streptomyces sp. NPDC029674 TaxID=3365297 RepID=UPI0038505651
MTSAANYPDLGFDPAPGDCDTVKALHKKLDSCVTVLRDTRKVVTKLMDGSYWEGDAAVAFRETIDEGPLSLNLKNAARSIEKAAKQLERWEGDLDDFQRRARELDRKAKDAREALKAAKGHADTVGGDPDLDEKGKGKKQDDAKKALKLADAKVEDAQAELDRILGRARSLQSEHDERSKYRAEKIRDATDKLAPHEPGWFEKACEWVKENLPDILSAIAGVLALAAIVATGPLGLGVAAALMLAASATSGVALGVRLWDPEVRESLWDGFTKGEFDADFFGNLVSVGADAVGMVPGLGAVIKGGRTATQAVRAGAGAMSLGQKMTTYGTHTLDAGKDIARLGNPLVNAIVTSDVAATNVATTSGALGLGTAGYGLIDDDEGRAEASTKVDGGRLLLDLPGIPTIARFAFS